MGDWRAIEHHEGWVKTKLGNTPAQVALSAYDIPTHYRHCMEGDQLVIHFKYPTDETTSDVKTGEAERITLIVGSSSKRIYGVKVERKGFSALLGMTPEKIARMIIGKIKEFHRQFDRPILDQHKVPKKVIFNHRDEFFSAMAV